MGSTRFRYGKMEMLRVRQSALVSKPDPEEFGIAYSEGAGERWDVRLLPDGSLKPEVFDEQATSMRDDLRAFPKSPVMRQDFSRRGNMSPPQAENDPGRLLVPVDDTWIKSHPLIGGGLEDELEPNPMPSPGPRRDLRGLSRRAPSPPPGFSQMPNMSPRASSPVEKKRIYNNRSPILGTSEAGLNAGKKRNIAKGPQPGQNFFRRKHPHLFLGGEDRSSIPAPMALPPSELQLHITERPETNSMLEDLMARLDASSIQDGLPKSPQIAVPEVELTQHMHTVEPSTEYVPNGAGDRIDVAFDPVGDINFKNFSWAGPAEEFGDDHSTYDQSAPSSSRAFGQWFGGQAPIPTDSADSEAANSAQVIENEELSPSVVSFFNTVKEQAMMASASTAPPGYGRPMPEGPGREPAGAVYGVPPMHGEVVYEEQIITQQLQAQAVSNAPSMGNLVAQGQAVSAEDFFRAAAAVDTTVSPIGNEVARTHARQENPAVTDNGNNFNQIEMMLRSGYNSSYMEPQGEQGAQQQPGDLPYPAHPITEPTQKNGGGLERWFGDLS
uniref:Uncharacterized protein n=1 Tax=Rhodosorus marinus TaxID=101924 RepID=A0A7S2ZJ17_9RHOD|mmetsp:Transcript_21224/g.86769  ORF Transcript_21224/g.86769 Transcript_21224/m.86769 type:complete len:554 (+) Transcript_21224:776-2437(+)|eukprot:CAMPEP_0113957232 /NCGR_PEP_ID=MMETSP0011_2-20120614/2646_1 /TAXON_ID=101924 /ORGANISM="Rhodosorus marinus" /LENGTH=553 /DNA_ID=CAMNT_0000967753 /DNA_START=803 /DNA_END=2464 /DNA_ORIENTATION=- /assembly_acc=CAM_ASM_000156